MTWRRCRRSDAAATISPVIVGELISDSGPLLRVYGERRGAAYGIIELVFAHGTLRLGCDPDTDEIVVAAAPASAAATDDLSEDKAFVSLLGKIAEHGWVLTNHHGYRDGFQLRLLDEDDRSEQTRQFEVAAAALTVRTVTR